MGSILLALLGLMILVPASVFAAVCICAGAHSGHVQADCLLVLGARVYADGRLSHSLQYRCDAALKAHREGVGDSIILCGGRGRDEPISEAEAMAAYLAEAGLPRELLFLEDRSANTIENLVNARRIMEQLGCRRAALVTSDYHLTRALWIARDVGIEAVGVAAHSPGTAYKRIKARVKETLSWLLYFRKKIGRTIESK